jgi:hypothetical protein
MAMFLRSGKPAGGIEDSSGSIVMMGATDHTLTNRSASRSIVTTSLWHDQPAPDILLLHTTLTIGGRTRRTGGETMRIRTIVSFLCFAAVLAAPAFAQEGEMPQMTPEQQAEMEAYMKAGALGPQHEMMAKEVGTYDVAVKSWMDPAAPPIESEGLAVRTLHMGGRVMQEDFQGDMMGTPFTGLSLSGFDNVSGKYWSTWNDSMSTGIMVSEGECDENHNCTFVGTYNDPITGGPVTNRYVVKRTSPDEQYFAMYGPGPDGTEVKMMEMIYTRR